MHEPALHLIVYNLKDHTMAREYCLENAPEGSRRARQKLFLALFKVKACLGPDWSWRVGSGRVGCPAGLPPAHPRPPSLHNASH
jgi:hypothetical protein